MGLEYLEPEQRMILFRGLDLQQKCHMVGSQMHVSASRYMCLLTLLFGSPFFHLPRPLNPTPA